jgi:hypothetical protein
MAGDVGGEARDSAGVRVVVPSELWREKILRGHPELAPHLETFCELSVSPTRSSTTLSTSAAVVTTFVGLVLVVGCSWS